MKENTTAKQTFISRFYIYQKERFPIVGHGVLILAFTFSAISFSRFCRGLEGFVSWQDFTAAFWVTFSSFFLLRIADEFKDREDDALYRKYLPVPRGLVSLSELKNIGFILLALQIVVVALVQPAMYLFYGFILLFLLLMRYEFFAPDWLKKHYMLYALSHMFIIPVIDMYASGVDWHLAKAEAPIGILFFLVVSYLNGLVLEIGRKLRMKGHEEEGVTSYSSLYGLNKALKLWMGIVTLAAACCFAAMLYADIPKLYNYLLVLLLLGCLIPALMVLQKPSVKGTKSIEKLSALWTVMMYLLLGGIPMLVSLIQ